MRKLSHAPVPLQDHGAGESSGHSKALQEQFCRSRDCMDSRGVLPKTGTWLLQVLCSIQGWLDKRLLLLLYRRLD